MSRFRPFTIMCCRKIPSKVKPKRNAARREGCIESIALPFITAVSQIFENMPRHEVHGLRGQRGLLQPRSVQNAAHLDHPVDRFDSHVRGVSHCLPRRVVQDREKHGILRRGDSLQVKIESGPIGERSLKQVLPQPVSAFPAYPFIKRVTVGVRIERRQRDHSSRQGCPAGTPSCGALDERTDWRFRPRCCRTGVIHIEGSPFERLIVAALT